MSTDYMTAERFAVCAGHDRQRDFYRHASHECVSCWNCGGDIYQPPIVDDGYPPGRGQYRAYCAKCDRRTWYDVGPA
jgi:hypothetical protein